MAKSNEFSSTKLTSRKTRDQITQDLDSIFPDFSDENESSKKANSSSFDAIFVLVTINTA